MRKLLLTRSVVQLIAFSLSGNLSLRIEGPSCGYRRETKTAASKGGRLELIQSTLSRHYRATVPLSASRSARF